MEIDEQQDQVGEAMYLFEEAKNKIQEGGLSTETMENVLEFLSEAVKKLVAVKGEFDIFLVPVYIEYGKALYRYSVMLGEELFFVFHDKRQEVGESEKTEAAEQVEGNLEAAWEILEVARSILENTAERENRTMLADVHSVLGEIQLENEKFECAISDFEKCLELRRRLFEEDAREVSGALFKLSICFEFAGKTEDAKRHTLEALALMERRMSRLKLSEEEHSEMQGICEELKEKLKEYTEGSVAHHPPAAEKDDECVHMPPVSKTS
ncbi:MAG: uncharacterized protein A8A55_0901 [Amphiamblys sp. WSBS2006]|nr:MAG: uncharacterized protein A8A55_0901 [Amphiamblys sp. WSBS2006]